MAAQGLYSARRGAAHPAGDLGAGEEPVRGTVGTRLRAAAKGRGVTHETMFGLLMLGITITAIFIGFPISFTLLFLAFAFGWWGLGDMVFNLAYFQTLGLMKESLLAAVPL